MHALPKYFEMLLSQNSGWREHGHLLPVHVVLDQQDRRSVAADALEERTQRGGLGGVHV